MNPELVIFDLDGTLIDSIGDLADAMNAVLERMGHPGHPRDQYRFLIGDGLEILVRRALPQEVVDATDIAGVVQEMRREYSTRWTATTRPFPEIPELLVALCSRKIQTAVLSNKPDFATLKIVDELFPEQPFEIVRGALDGVALKPNPTSSLALLSELGIEAGKAAFVGDTSIDMATGVNAGMCPVGVTWGFREAVELLAHGADHIIHSPLEFLDLLDGDLEKGV